MTPLTLLTSSPGLLGMALYLAHHDTTVSKTALEQTLDPSTLILIACTSCFCCGAWVSIDVHIHYFQITYLHGLVIVDADSWQDRAE
jgi:hypothetical protein